MIALESAKKEFPAHYAPDKVKTICDQRQAVVDAMPPEKLKQLMAQGADTYLAEADCQGFTRCVAPTVEKMLRMRQASGDHCVLNHAGVTA